MTNEEYKEKVKYWEEIKDATELNIFRQHYVGLTSDEERDKQLKDLKKEFESIKKELKINN